MPNREDYLEQVLGNMTKLIITALQTKSCVSFDQLSCHFQTSEPEIHKAVYALGCAVDEDKWGYLVLSAPTYAPGEAAKRFLQEKEL